MDQMISLPSSFSCPYIILGAGKDKEQVPLNQIIRLEAESNYTYIYLHNQRKLLAAKVLGAYELMLSPFGFVRVSRSQLVNKRYVQDVDSSGEVVMMDQSKVGISRRRKKAVKLLLKSGTGHI